MVSVKYVAPIFEPSGYGRAARDYCYALIEAGVDLTIQPINFKHSYSDFIDSSIQRLAPYLYRDIKFDAQIIHCTPEHWPTYLHNTKPNICMFAWETDKIPTPWLSHLNNDLVSTIWVPCTLNRQTVEDVTSKLVSVVPHTLDVGAIAGHAQSLELRGVPDDTFVFYSILQWTERKNPEALLKAYLTGFNNTDSVLLLLKSYRFGFSDDGTAEMTNRIAMLRQRLGLKSYPKILLIPNKLNTLQLLSLHQRGDCYVSAHRGEGWGIPLSTAICAGNYAIATNWSGNKEYMNHRTSSLVDYFLTPVCDQEYSPWYTGDQRWADISVYDLSNTMRKVYNDPASHKVLAKEAQASLNKRFNYITIGQKMRSHLESITNG